MGLPLATDFSSHIGRRQLASSSNGKEKRSTKDEEAPVMLKVGHGQFKLGKFTRISANSLSLQGGIVLVGPFNTEGNTTEEIKKAAFEKFSMQNRLFKQKFESHTQFVLVYPDGKKVDMLPDGKEEFSILKYRNFLDPKKRFDRLRLYICNTKNYQENEVEVVSCSSSLSEELPVLKSTCPKTDEENDPLTVDVHFLFKERVFEETFPNNAQISELSNYAATLIGKSPACVVLKMENGLVLADDDRLMGLS
ncbi:uncharacterized protein LOC133200045 [Saccostrea echinata]|uniref:uncharacterized protein LOC133200045 n=1 Tax=Saccostrea echinata TaxID=191078 RepID=UPI002A807786|nr:uncharacterized protein LOC133200045 [Saccostrea echinata]